MYRFTLSSDSTCDLYRDFTEQNDIRIAPLSFTIEENGKMTECLDNFTEYRQYTEFYDRLRAGAFSKTAMLNYEAHYNHFLAMAKEGAKDVVHFTISSGLARTHEVAKQAAEDLKKDYPDFKVYVVDPLSATVGQGMLVRLALECRNKGMTAQEAYDRCMYYRMHIQHYVVADDLGYLKRGGRITAAVAAIGGVLNIKPILSFDKAGKLDSIAKVRGVKKAISFIEEKLLKEGPDPDLNYVFIVHTGNEPAAEELKKFVVDRLGIEPYVQIMGPVIGSHVGPGAFALAYITKSERNEF